MTINKSGVRSFLSGFSGLVPLFILAHFAHHLMGALLGPLWPSIRDHFAIDYTQFGFLYASYGLAYGLGNLPGGWLADRIGQRLLITISISGVALAGLLVSLSPNYTMMIVFLILLGVVGGGYHVSAPPLIAESVEPNKRGSALGLHMIGGSGCFFLAPLVAVGIAGQWGWRSPLIALSLPVMVFGIVFYKLLRRLPQKKKVEDSMVSTGETEVAPSSARWRRLIPFMVLSVLAGAIGFTPQAFLPLFLVDNFGTSQETVAVFLAIIAASGLVAGPLGGYLSDRLGAVPVMLAACFTAGPLIYLLNVAPYAVALGAVFIGTGIVMYIRMPVSEAYIVSHTPERYRSTLLGIYYFSSSEISSVLTPVAGNLIDRFGFYTTFTILGATMVIMTLVCSIWLWGSRD